MVIEKSEVVVTPVHKNWQQGRQGSWKILNPWLYKVIDKRWGCTSWRIS